MDPVKKLLIFSLLLGKEISGSRWISDGDEVWMKIRTRLLFPTNFASVRINSHHERELRISYEKVVFMETFLRSGYSSDYDMIFRQITDGGRILQAVFQGGILKECDMNRNTNAILDFISNFVSPLDTGNSAANVGNVLTSSSITNYTEKDVTLAYFNFQQLAELDDLAKRVNMRRHRKDCQKFLRVATETAEEEARTGNFSNIYDTLLQNLDPDIVQKETEQIFHNASEKSGSKKIQEHNVSKRSTAPVKRSRSKRAVLDFNSVLIFPGTKWCGKGDLAQCYDDLGDDQELDSCCRDHDCCPFVIPPFSSRFNLFNFRFHSLLHCDCDQRFRGCLRESQSAMANMIGKIYFNILGSKCFDFIESDVCVERTWWGRCRKYETQTTAKVKNQITFIDDVNAVNKNNS